MAYSVLPYTSFSGLAPKELQNLSQGVPPWLRFLCVLVSLWLISSLCFQMEKDHGFSAVKHQSFVGAGYYDQVQSAVTSGEASTAALKGSTEETQFATAAE